jgi:hypothetical protein
MNVCKTFIRFPFNIIVCYAVLFVRNGVCVVCVLYAFVCAILYECLQNVTHMSCMNVYKT